MTARETTKRAGQRTAVLIAGIGVLWISANAAGAYWDWSNRTRALFDLVALAGFGFALLQTFILWRKRQHDDKG